MARRKLVRKCFGCGVTFTWEKGANDSNGNFVRDENGSVRQVETATGKIHYCTKKQDNIGRETETHETGETETVDDERDAIVDTSDEIETVESTDTVIDSTESLTDAGKAIYKLIEPAIEKRLEGIRRGETRVYHDVRIHDKDGSVRIVAGAHVQMATLLRYLSLKLKVMLVGPAGSGKTYAAEQAAKELGLTYYPQSVGPQTSKSDLIGYKNGLTGELIRTPGRDAYEHGGLWLIDEIDAANAAVLTIINMMLANSTASFPDGTISRHPDFRVVASANTYGQGANRMYVGRNQLDAASLDRFVGIDWLYDNALETIHCESHPEWLAYIWKLREAQERLKIRVVLSMRAIIEGCTMLDDGISRSEVETARLWFGVSSDDKAKLLAGIR